MTWDTKKHDNLALGHENMTALPWDTRKQGKSALGNQKA
jgi:hypothetical protein